MKTPYRDKADNSPNRESQPKPPERTTPTPPKRAVDGFQREVYMPLQASLTAVVDFVPEIPRYLPTTGHTEVASHP